jgi:hypothetical protein
MTQGEKVEHEKLRSELRDLKRENHELRCKYGDLRDAIVDAVFDWEQSKTLPSERQLDYLVEVSRKWGEEG